MFYKRNNDGYKEAVKGVAMKTLVHGEHTETAGASPATYCMAPRSVPMQWQ